MSLMRGTAGSALAWQRVDPPLVMKGMFPGTRAWQAEVSDGHLSVLAGMEPDREFGGPRWHLSVSHRTNDHPARPGRYPSWDEIVDARYRFIPDHVRVAMLLPPRAEWVNAMPTCFHLWEIDDTRANLALFAKGTT